MNKSLLSMSLLMGIFSGCGSSYEDSVLQSISKDIPFVIGYNENENCRKNSDPFWIPAYIFGSFQPATERTDFLKFQLINTSNPADINKCVDNNYYRPVLKLTSEGKKSFQIDNKESVLAIANVKHIDSFYVAQIPVDAAYESTLVLEHFKMPILGYREGHFQIRIKFNKPVKLIQQFPKNLYKTLEVYDLILTANPVGHTRASSLDISHNIDGSLLIANNIQTLETRLEDGFMRGTVDKMSQYALKLSPKEVQQYLKYYVDYSERNRYSKHFVIYGLNCTSTHFLILDRLFKNRYKNINEIKKSNAFDPSSAVKSLTLRNLLDSHSQLPDVQTEARAMQYIQKR